MDKNAKLDKLSSQLTQVAAESWKFLDTDQQGNVEFAEVGQVLSLRDVF